MSEPVILRIYRMGQLLEVKQLTDEQIVVGAAADVQVRLDAPEVSSIHCMIERRQDAHYICDLGSEKGTLLNGERILDAKIKSEDRIGVGPFQIEYFVGIPRKVSPGPTQNVVIPPPPPPPSKKPIPKLDLDFSSVKVEPSAEGARRKGSDTVSNKTVPVKEMTSAQTEKPPAKEADTLQSDESLVKPKAPQKTFEKKSVPIKKIPDVVPLVTAPDEIRSSEIVASSSQGATEIIPDIDLPLRGQEQSAYSKSREPKIEPTGPDLIESLELTKGSQVEVLVGWRDRVISTYHFDSPGTFYVGNHPKNQIFLPLIGMGFQGQPLIKIDRGVQIFIQANSVGCVKSSKSIMTFSELISKSLITPAAGGYWINLQQEELIQVEFSDGVSVYIRYRLPSPKPALAPFLFFSTSELATIVGTIIFTTIAALYFAVYSPEIMEEDKVEEEVLRKAVFVYKKRSQPQKVAEQGLQDTPKPNQPAAGSPIRLPEKTPAEAAPNNSQSNEVRLTSKNIGKGTSGTANKSAGEKAGAAAPAPRDVRKTGLLSVFGTKGTQSAIEKAVSGSDVVGGLSRDAKGQGGLGAGDNSSASEPGLKTLGKGGSGTATVGIAGVNTKGRGGGVTGYGDGGLGGIKGTKIIPGGSEEAFTGTIDKEAIRRVILQNLRQIKSCYERALNRNPSLFGKVVIRWTIVERGRVGSANVDTSSLNNSEVETCIVNKFRTWRFPDPPPGQEAEVVYPFVFASQN
ncbi:MAG: hypothetical protein COT74_06675 [Bdellovibrionales bacterium CG10_big_fil_rev_8_21_14_0_10_45_34]|nr:MAG: hypothetical protein COT74_06675 [Bdellovibrionales bacterium CG10_big_fil_rev_8_21_14_0_10_45_34]